MCDVVGRWMRVEEDAMRDGFMEWHSMISMRYVRTNRILFFCIIHDVWCDVWHGAEQNETKRNSTHNLNPIHLSEQLECRFTVFLSTTLTSFFYCISSGFSDWQIHKKIIPYISIDSYLQFFSFLLTLWTIREKWWSQRVQNNLKSEEKDGLGKSKKVSLPRRMFLGIIPIPFFLPILLPLQVR